MTQYQKLGTLLARMAGVVIVLHGIVDLMQTMRMVWMVDRIKAQGSSISLGSFIWALAPVVVGVLVFALAKPIGYFLAKGLDE